jgi:hypothetical protein
MTIKGLCAVALLVTAGLVPLRAAPLPAKTTPTPLSCVPDGDSKDARAKARALCTVAPNKSVFVSLRSEEGQVRIYIWMSLQDAQVLQDDVEPLKRFLRAVSHAAGASGDEGVKVMIYSDHGVAVEPHESLVSDPSWRMFANQKKPGEPFRVSLDFDGPEIQIDLKE